MHQNNVQIDWQNQMPKTKTTNKTIDLMFYLQYLCQHEIVHIQRVNMALDTCR